MKSVVFFLYDLRIGGAEKVIVQLSNYFINTGYKVFEKRYRISGLRKIMVLLGY